jgi:hypothetical protein
MKNEIKARKTDENNKCRRMKYAKKRSREAEM